MGANVRITSGQALERVGDLAAILSNLAKGDVLFIDEIHRMNKTIEEVLYPAMEDYALDLVVGKGRFGANAAARPRTIHHHRRDNSPLALVVTTARPVRLDLPP